MKIDGNALYYVLSQSFEIVSADSATRSMRVDYPLVYSEGADLRDHIVLVPPAGGQDGASAPEGALCVCVDTETARLCRMAGCSVVQLAEGTSFNALCNCVQRAFVRFERLDAQLQSYVDTYASFQDLLDTCTAQTGCPFVLIDDQYRVIGRSLRDGEEQRLGAGRIALRDLEAFDLDTIDLFMASRKYQDMRSSRNVFAVPGSLELLMKNIFSGERLACSLMASHDGTMGQVRYVKFLLRYLAEYVGELYEKRGMFVLADERSDKVKRELAEAASGMVEACARLDKALVEDGHAPESAYVVLRVERSFTNETCDEEGFLIQRLESSLPHAYCFVHEDCLYMLADTFGSHENDAHDFFGELPLVARENLVEIGMSRAFSTMDNLSAAMLQAEIALQQGGVSGSMNWLFRFDAFAFDWIVARAKGKMSYEVLCHPALTTLLRYDEQHGSDLVGTLETFMRCRYNVTLAAEKLFVARSTLLNRLERIQALTGVSFDDYDERLYLAFSLKLRGDRV